MTTTPHIRARNRRLGRAARRLRQERGISLRRFAMQANMSATYLSKIERGDFPPPAEEKIKAMARLPSQDEDEFLALAGRVASDLTDIIRERPEVMADLLRAVRGLPEDEVKQLLAQAEKAKSTPPRRPGRSGHALALGMCRPARRFTL